MPTSRSTLACLAAGVCVAAMAVAGCGDSEPGSSGTREEQGSSGPLVVAWYSEPPTLDPVISQVGSHYPTAQNVFEGLTRLGTDHEILPALAESWERIDDTTWRFKLRPDITFHNGEPLDAEAVAFSVKHGVQPDSENLPLFGSIEKAQAAGPNEVDIITAQPDPYVPRAMAFLAILPPKYVQEQPKQFEVAPVGTGPYVFKRWDRGQAMYLEANPNYWGEQPEIKSVTIRLIEDGGVRVQALRAGEIHLARALSPDQAPQAPKVLASFSAEVCAIRLTNEPGPLADLRVRQAANHAIDRKSIIDNLFGDYAVMPRGQIVTEASFGFDPDLTDYEYDPARAKALLEAAGYNGERIDVVGESANRWSGDRELVLATVDHLKQAGFNAHADIRQWELYLEGIWEDPQSPAVFVCMSDDNRGGLRVLESWTRTDGPQATFYDPRIDKLLDAAKTEFDDDKRAEHLRAVHRLLFEEAAFIPLSSVKNIWGAAEELEWQPRADDLVYFSEMRLGG